MIAADLAERPVRDPFVIYIGDYLDRGPDSAGAIDAIAETAIAPSARRVLLMGNHERMLLDALARPAERAAVTWLANGGDASLRSWGVDPRTPPAEWQKLLPSRHLDFLHRLEPRFQVGGYLFVHAGVRPGVPLAEQDLEDLLWIREPFLKSKADHGAVIVHGHTPRPDPEVRPNRIGIDTGAVYGGPLTCAVLEETLVGFIQT
jgi:serine/threonine protein phosphatase 1